MSDTDNELAQLEAEQKKVIEQQQKEREALKTKTRGRLSFADPGKRHSIGWLPFDYAENNEHLKGTDACRRLNDARFQ